jgi:hypothetical protein
MWTFNFKLGDFKAPFKLGVLKALNFIVFTKEI